jgi:hypothetical protein
LDAPGFKKFVICNLPRRFWHGPLFNLKLQITKLQIDRQAVRQNSLMIKNVTAATEAEAGMVSTHAQTMRVATPQRTAERR